MTETVSNLAQWCQTARKIMWLGIKKDAKKIRKRVVIIENLLTNLSGNPGELEQLQYQKLMERFNAVGQQQKHLIQRYNEAVRLRDEQKKALGPGDPALDEFEVNVKAIREEVGELKDKMASMENYANDLIFYLEMQKRLCTEPFSTLVQYLSTWPNIAYAMAQDLAYVKLLQANVQKKIDQADWDDFEPTARLVMDECNALRQRPNVLYAIEYTYAGDPDAKLAEQSLVARNRANVTEGLMRNYQNGANLFAGYLSNAVGGLPHAILEVENATQQPINRDALTASIGRLVELERMARMALAAYAPYDVLRRQVDSMLNELSSHSQASHLRADLQAIRVKYANVHQNGPTTGWQGARVAMQVLVGQCKALQTLAKKLDLHAKKLPLIRDSLNKLYPRLDAKFESVALKIVADEGCTIEEAVRMAKLASDFEAEQVPELDAIVSARTEHHLRQADPQLSDDHAHAICKMLRARGSATVDDTIAVATQMKRLPRGAINMFNGQNIENQIFRGPVTEADPKLTGVLPPGWPPGKTWDNVPGMGGDNAIFVGTMDDGFDPKTGKALRKIPGPNEGPVKHGTPDLLGHEAGHTFDKMGGANRRNDLVFVNARATLLNAGDQGLVPDRDNYFMERSETLNLPLDRQSKQTEDAARSETFAESFALHCQGERTKWAALMTFWQRFQYP